VNKSGKKVEKIINALKPSNTSYNAKGFYSYQIYLKDNLQHSLNKETLKKVISFCEPSCPVFSIE
jgi:hypothetical protein